MDSKLVPMVMSLAFRYAMEIFSRSSSLSLMLRSVSEVRSVPSSSMNSRGESDRRALVTKSMSADILLSLTVSSWHDETTRTSTLLLKDLISSGLVRSKWLAELMSSDMNAQLRKVNSIFSKVFRILSESSHSREIFFSAGGNPLMMRTSCRVLSFSRFNSGSFASRRMLSL